MSVLSSKYALLAEELGVSMASRFFADFDMTPTQSRYHAKGIAAAVAIGMRMPNSGVFVDAVMAAFESEVRSFDVEGGEL